MLKKVIIVVGILVLLVGGAIIYAASNANSLIAQYKPDLEKAASEAVGSPVTLGALNVSVFPSTKVEVSELTVGAKEKLSLKNFYLSLGLLDLLRGQLTIKKIGVQKPEIIIRKVGDQLFIPGVPSGDSANKQAPTTQPAAAKEAAPKSDASPLKIAVQGLEVTDAAVTLDDRDAGKIDISKNFNLDTSLTIDGSNITLPKLDVNGQVFSAPLKVNGTSTIGASDSTNSLNGSLTGLSAKEISKLLAAFKVALPVTLDGALSTNFEVHGKGSSPEVDLRADLSGFGVTGAAFSKAVGKRLIATSKVKVAQLSPLNVTSNTKLELEELSVPPTYVANLNGNISKSIAGSLIKVSSSDLNLNLGKEPVKIALDAELNGANTELKRMEISGFGGTTNLSASINGNALLAVSKIEQVQLDQLLAAALPATSLPLKGELKSFGASINGQLGNDLMNSLKGPINAELGSFKIEGFNLLGKILGELKKTPIFGNADVGAENKAEVESKDTSFTGATFDGYIADGEVQIRSARAASSLFSAFFTGTSSLAGAVNLKGTFILEKPVTAALTASAKDTAKFANANGQLEIPVVIKGQGSQIVVLPDIEAFLASAAGKAIQDQAGKALNRLLGGKSKRGGLFGF